MRVKAGVRVLGVKAETVLGMMVVDSVYVSHFGRGFTLTSCVEGNHSPSSNHYKGLAFDAGVHDIPAAAVDIVFLKCRDELGADWDVVHENAGTPNEHIHCEFDPKAPLGVQ